MPQHVELVVLDLAGTTIADEGHVPAAFRRALALHGVGVSEATVDAVRGAAKRHAIRELVPPSPGRDRRVSDIYDTFRSELHARLNAGPLHAIAGAAATIAAFRSAGVRVALTTGFDGDTTARILDSLGWQEAADAVVSADQVAAGRPAPYLIFHAMESTMTMDVRRVAAVGDTALDLEAGYNAGVRWNIGVLTGAHSRERLEKAPHTHIISSVAELRTVLGCEN